MKVKLTKDINRSGYIITKDQIVNIEFIHEDKTLGEVLDGGMFLGLYLYPDEYLIEVKPL